MKYNLHLFHNVQDQTRITQFLDYKYKKGIQKDCLNKLNYNKQNYKKKINK